MNTPDPASLITEHDPSDTKQPAPATAQTYDIAAWKAYTHEGPAWRLDDDIGTGFCNHVRSLGQSVICVHKVRRGRMRTRWAVPMSNARCETTR